MQNFLKLALVGVVLLAGVALPTFVSAPAHAAIAQDEGEGGGEGGGDEGGEGGGGEEGGGESGGGGEEGGGD